MKKKFSLLQTEEELAAYRKTMTPVKKNPFVPVFTGVSAEERKTFADSVSSVADRSLADSPAIFKFQISRAG